MVNYAFAFSQSELGKYFEWILSLINLSLSFKLKDSGFLETL